MEMLDEPPRNWQEFILTTWLAELATWSMASAYLDHPHRTVAGIVRKIGEEAYFHLKYSVGWFRIMQTSDAERQNVAEAVSKRLPVALQWFGNPADDSSLADVRSGFIREAENGLAPLAINVNELATVEYGPSWRPTFRRNDALPERLFEVIRFKDPDLAAR
jgi:ring-1,2-phenylacetyl-CoA epoxidase subunit PaaC